LNRRNSSPGSELISMRPIRDRLVQVLSVFVLASNFAIPLAARTASPADEWVVVVSVANMYSSATENADVVSQAILGSDVVVLERRHKWAKVRTPDQYTGWIPVRELRKLRAGIYAAPGHAIQVESLFANIYRETDVTAHQPLLTVPFESRLEPVTEASADAGRWLQIRLPDGRTAWIQNSDVIRDPKPLTIDESIALAKRFLGLPYLWGGRSSYGYDCSGFTQMLVRSRGINMPRDADLQAAWEGVAAVDRKELRAGDLLFFGGSADKITHTGMYIGGGEFIHDTTNGHPVIQISRLDDQPWTRLLVACRRVK
jgi:gamma-D-glutamyl-L-lysine dipeptidyl-peptidase